MNDHSRTRLAITLPVIAILLLISCATTGPGGKKSFILISTNQEVSIGQEMDRQLRQTETILDDPLWQNYINELGQKIVAVSDRSQLPFHFAVIESDQINAFAAPGGFVYFYTGLIREMDQEAELAAVMAHEISHVVGRHSVKRLQSVLGLAIVMELALGEGSDRTKDLAGAALGIMMSGYSRSQEKEADNFGTLYMTGAGWHPDGMVAMFNKLKELSGHKQTDFFEMLASTHPDTDDRIATTQAQIAGLTGLSGGLKMDDTRFREMKKRLPPPKTTDKPNP
jgi:predicted Zn-dependent protease